MKKFVVFLAVICFAISCDPGEKAPRLGSIQGQTFIGSTNESLPGLIARLPGYGEQITDLNGFFRFDNVVEGDYVVSIYQASQFLDSRAVSVFEGNVSNIFFPFEYEVPPQKELPDFTVVDLTNDPAAGWDDWVRGKNEYGNEECFHMKTVNYLPTLIAYHTFEDGKYYVITFDSKGLPKTIFANNAILFFDNFNGKKFDLGILSPSGEMQILRDLETDFDWTAATTKSPQSRADAIRWAGTILGAVSCGASIAVAASTGGFATYLAIWTCGNFFLKTTSNFLEDANVENGFTNFVNKYKLNSTIYVCAVNPTDPTQCLTKLAQEGLNAYADYVEEIDVRAEYVSKLEILLANNTPPKNIIFQPGPEGKDAHISLAGFSDPCREFYGNSGNDSIISVVHDSWNSCSVQVDEMLLQFSIGLIPINAVIASAQLELYGYATINQYNSSPIISVSELKDSWSEGDVSWTTQPESEIFASSTFVSSGELLWHSWDITNLVQDWVSGRKDNFGVLISPSNNYVWGEFYSGDNPDISHRPRLVVSYYSK